MDISITPRNTGPARAHACGHSSLALSCALSTLVSSLVPLPRPDGGASRNPIFSTSASHSQFSNVYVFTSPWRSQRTPPKRESHLGSAEGAGSRSLLAHVSGPHHAPIIPYHVVLSSPAFSDPQRHLKTKVYIPLLTDERRIGYIDYKASSLVQSGLPSRPSFFLPSPSLLDP